MTFAQALSAALLHFLWQGLAVAIVLWLALRCLQHRAANTRYLTACAALATLALLPAATALMLWSPPVRAATPSAFDSLRAVAMHSTGGAAGIDPLAVIQRWALPIWSAGVLILSLRLVWAWGVVSRLRKSGEAADARVLAAAALLRARFGIARPVRVLVTTLTDGPSVIGWLRPVLLLPAATLLHLTPEQLESILAHEFAHIRRHDYLVNIAQTLVETLLFYHPAVWWISARIRHERELCCDDAAVQACGDPACYARALLTLERLRAAPPALAMGIAGDSLLYRIQRLAGLPLEPAVPSRLPGILAIALGLLGLIVNLGGARAQEVPSQVAELLHVNWISRPDRPGVTVETGAAILHRVSVEFPEAARARGIQGTVVVEATLAANGTVDDARIVSGPADLRRAALQSVLQWHFVKDYAGSTRQITIRFDASKAEAPAPDSESAVSTNFAVAERVEVLGALEGPRTASTPSGETLTVPGTPGVVLEAGALISEDRAAPLTLTGKIIESIQIDGLPDGARHELLAAIPAHAGATLTGELFQKITAAVRDFDEHLEINVGENRQHHVELHITAPNSGGSIELRSIR